MPITSKFLPYPEGAKMKQFTAELAEDQTSIELVNSRDKDSLFFRDLENKGINLNRSQISAVRHGEGPALVLAGAGSGKTRVLTARAGYLITINKVNPSNILLVTFSKKAAEEMKERLSQVSGLSYAQAKSVTSGTFHSIFWRLLKSKGYKQNIISSDKQKQIAIKLLLKEKKLQDAYEPETLLSLLSSYKNKALTVKDLPNNTVVEKEIKSVLESYENWKLKNNYFDFDDMLLESYHLLLSDTELLKAMQSKFQYILVDEWQDTNPLQYHLIKMLAEPLNNLFVVGDDDQTIYSFNGADQSIIMDFKKRFPKSYVFILDINYRSNPKILGIANQVIDRNSIRNKKKLKATKKSDIPPYFIRPSNTDEEAAIIIKQINKLVTEENRTYKDIAILHRTISNSRAIVDELVRTRIPFVTYTKGESFYEQQLVKPVIDYLRASVFPEELEAVKGIAPTLFINREVAMRHIQNEQKKEKLQHPLKHLITLPNIQDYQRNQIRDRVKMIVSLKEMEPVAAIRRIRKYYDNFLQANERSNVTMHKDLIIETLTEIEAAAKQFNSVADFLQFINNVIIRHEEMDKMRNNPYADAVSLMTIHRSKGLEFPVVFLIGASESILPHSSSLHADSRKDVQIATSQLSKTNAALEEERRLAYVAITRAEEEIYISSPSYYRGEQVDISRFLLDPYLATDSQKNNSPLLKKKSLIWQCTHTACICWIRIVSDKETQKKERECPMCKSLMIQTMKEISP